LTEDAVLTSKSFPSSVIRPGACFDVENDVTFVNVDVFTESDSSLKEKLTSFLFFFFNGLNVIVTLTNETNLTITEKGEDGTNVVIVAVIIVVTIVLSAAIIVTICIIRRLDLGHRHQKNNQDKQENIK
jgi:hypothetical protein